MAIDSLSRNEILDFSTVQQSHSEGTSQVKHVSWPAGLSALHRRRPTAHHRRDNPDLLRTSASFAALCGTAPIPVSFGRTDRYRLSRGGDRQANAALHHIVKNRMTNDERTRAYRDVHLAKGWSTKAVYRALKRAVARQIFAALAAVATALEVWPARVGELELGRRRDDDFTKRYRRWLNAA